MVFPYWGYSILTQSHQSRTADGQSAGGNGGVRIRGRPYFFFFKFTYLFYFNIIIFIVFCGEQGVEMPSSRDKAVSITIQCISRPPSRVLICN